MAIPKRLKAKICLVGEAAVGKTSLIRRYVLDRFDDSYLMTLGAKVSKKRVGVTLPARDPRVHLEEDLQAAREGPDARTS